MSQRKNKAAQAGAECPGLSVLRGVMGLTSKGKPITPGHINYEGRCGNCGHKLKD